MSHDDMDLVEIIVMMMVWAVVLVAFCIGYDARGASGDDWFCTERAVVKEDRIYKSCGVASSTSESIARMNAFTDAKREFVNVCDSSHDCLGYEVNMEPRRTECFRGFLGWTCRRLLVFHVLETRFQFQYHPNYYMYMRSR